VTHGGGSVADARKGALVPAGAPIFDVWFERPVALALDGWNAVVDELGYRGWQQAPTVSHLLACIRSPVCSHRAGAIVTITVDDPQVYVDLLIEHVRETRLQARKSTRLTFVEYAMAARGTAVKRHYADDAFGEKLTLARAAVYDAAADLVREMPLPEAAAEMMRRALDAQVRTPRWVGYDADAVSYITARAWQFCAWKIDPSLPAIQPEWS